MSMPVGAPMPALVPRADDGDWTRSACIIGVPCPDRVARMFEVVEATIGGIHAAYQAGTLTARQLVQSYLDRIEKYEKRGPQINCITNLNPEALADADKLDAAFKSKGLTGPLHGIPVILKDQVD